MLRFYMNILALLLVAACRNDAPRDEIIEVSGYIILKDQPPSLFFSNPSKENLIVLNNDEIYKLDPILERTVKNIKNLECISAIFSAKVYGNAIYKDGSIKSIDVLSIKEIKLIDANNTEDFMKKIDSSVINKKSVCFTYPMLNQFK